MWNKLVDQLQINYRINIFVSHSWRYACQYETIVSWLKDAGFQVKNYSIPKDNPCDAETNKKLVATIIEQIKHASVVIVCAGIHVSHSEWIQFEIETALQMKKPILAVKPYGNSELPSIITTNHDKIRTINWRASSVIAAVESLLK